MRTRLFRSQYSFGVRHFIKDHPMELFAELGLNLYVAPDLETDVALALGFRYFF
ncbi:MAG: hypothetical protein R2827_04950 [Bdellovibrionales bacterium]